MIAAYMNRTAASFTVNTQDIILQAMNDARRAAQRAHTFELNRTEDAYLGTHLGGANWMTGCTTTPGGMTSLLMVRIDEVWNYSPYLISPTTYYVRTSRVPFSYTGQFKRNLPTITDRVELNTISVNSQNQFAYAVGNQLFVSATTNLTYYKLVGIKYLDDLTGSEDPDIFLTYFTDWFKYATIEALNIYLKDSERFPIDNAAMSKMFETVKTLDGSIANMGESSNLD